jgi:hypothetical protein
MADPVAYAQAQIDQWHGRIKAGGGARPSGGGRGCAPRAVANFQEHRDSGSIPARTQSGGTAMEPGDVGRLAMVTNSVPDLERQLPYSVACNCGKETVTTSAMETVHCSCGIPQRFVSIRN